MADGGGRGIGGGAADGRLFTSAFLALTASELAYFTSFGVMITVLPLFARDILRVDSLATGVAIGVFSVVALLLRPLAGRLADVWGRRRLLLAGAVLFTLTVGAHVLVDAYLSLILLRVLLGVAEAAYFVAGVALLADLAPADRLGEALSYNSLGLYLGITVGPALGDALVQAWGFTAGWLGAAVLGALATVIAVVWLPVTEQGSMERTSERGPMIPRTMLGPGLTFTAGLMGSAGFLYFAAIYSRGIGMAGAGTVLFAYGAVVVASRLLLGRFMDRPAAVNLSAASLLICAAGLAAMALVPTSAGLTAGAALLGLGVAFLTPAFYRVLIARARPGSEGAAAATFSIMVDLGLGGGPIVWGLIVRFSDIPSAMAVFAGLAILAAFATMSGGNPRRALVQPRP